MANDHDLPENLDASDANGGNPFESFQRQLDAFMEQEKSVIGESEQDSSELQHHLDHFINKLQHELDTFMEENPNHISITNVSDPGDDEQELVQLSEQPGNMPPQSARINPAPELPVTEESANATAYSPASYSKLITSALIGASWVIAVILWFFWPIEHEQAANPQLLQQQAVDEHDSRFSLTTSESMVSKPVAEEIRANRLSQPVHAAQPEMTRQHGISKIEIAVQPKPKVAVKLKVAVRIGNIRSAPDGSAKVLHKLVKGASVTKLAEHGKWFQVRLRNGTVAWAHRSIF